jgi:hypothetical protein
LRHQLDELLSQGRIAPVPLNIMEHVIADLVFIFRLQPFTQEVEIYYIDSVLVVPSLYLILSYNELKFEHQFYDTYIPGLL